jgi:DNA-binding beta-propeller fold protein YncE
MTPVARRCALFAVVIALLVPVAAFAQAPTYVSSWPSTGLPLGLAVDATQRRVYLVDELSNTYRLFDVNGNPLGIVGDGFEEYGVLVCPDGTVLISNYYGCFVRRYDAAGNVLAQWPTGGIRALDLATDAEGNVYVTDDEGDRVRKFSPTGTLLAQWPQTHPCGIAHFNGRIYVSGMWSGTMFVYDTNGVLQWSFQTGFTWAEQLTVDAQGRLYMVDHGTKRLRCWDPDGTRRWTLGPVVPGYPFADIDMTSVALVGDGTILLGDYNNRRVLVLRESPVPVASTTWGGLKGLYRE